MNDKCKICESQTREIYDKKFDISYYHCKLCDFISMDENKIIYPEAEKEVYDRHENTYENEGYVNMFMKFLKEAVIDYTSDGKDALDFGSGPGPVLARILTEKFHYNTDIYDLYYSPEKVYEGKKYDLVTCTEVAEHLRYPMEYFRLFKSLLKEEGILGIMTAFHPEDDEKFCQWYYRRDQTHISFYTPRTMEYIGNKIGLKVRYLDEKRYCSFSLK